MQGLALEDAANAVQLLHRMRALNATWQREALFIDEAGCVEMNIGASTSRGISANLRDRAKTKI